MKQIKDFRKFMKKLLCSLVQLFLTQSLKHSEALS